MTQRPTVLAYISGHGFGHAARTGLVLAELQALAPDARIVVRSSTPDWMFPPTAECAPLQVDVGVVQIDSLTPLLDETVDAAYRFEQARPGLVAGEIRVAAKLAPRLIVGDIPALAFDVASGIGVPGIAIGNFGWSWIYRNLGSERREIGEIVDRIAQSEGRATTLLRLPLHDEMTTFPRIEDVPLIAHLSHADRDETRRAIGESACAGSAIDDDRPLALLSFGGMGMRLDVASLSRTPDVRFVLTAEPTGAPPENVLVCHESRVAYHDLLAACDCVIMKPGYGTVADCLANHVPMVYATRPGFAEQAILVRAMHEMGRASYVANEELTAGELGRAIRAALDDRTDWSPLPTNGAATVAERVATLGNLCR